MGKSRGAYQRGNERGRVALRAKRLALNLSQDQVAAQIVAFNREAGFPTPAPLSGMTICRYELGATVRECWLAGYAHVLALSADELERLLDLPLVH